MKHLVIDTSNILFRVASAHGKYNSGGSVEDQAGLAMHMTLNTIKSHHRRVQPDQVALAFEGANNWRKTYTKSDACVSKQVYKANRVKDDSMIPFFELIKAFEQLAREHTSIVCLSNPVLEGDDCFAAYVQHFTALGDEVVGLSGDKDFVQLFKHQGFSLLNPDKSAVTPRNEDGKGNKIDPEFFMFEKAIRGDSGDYVMSAFPRVRNTRIMKAFNDPFERANLMNAEWEYNDPSSGVTRRHRVGDLFEENQLLMNLERQPQWIRDEMVKTVLEAQQNRGKFSLFHFQKFCGKFALKKIGEEVASYVDLLSGVKQDISTSTVKAAPKRAGTLVF